MKDLKQELLSEVVVPLSRAAIVGAMGGGAMTRAAREFARTTTLANAAAPPSNVPEVPRFIALGIAREGREYRLAVRVQRQGLLSSEIVKHIVDQALGEADVRFVGRLEKRGAVPRVRVFGPAGPQLWYRANVRPLLIGASVGHVDVTAGSIGAFVSQSGRACILSNNHVLANEDRSAAGDAVLQRGSADGGRSARDEVAALHKSVPLRKDGVNMVDAALAEIREGEEYAPSRLRGLIAGGDQRLAGSGPDFMDEGDLVYKLGRTTGPTEGRITAFELDNVVISFDSGNLRFDEQVEIEGTGSMPFSDGGDSGSLIVDEQMRAVALLFAGGDLGGSNGLGLTYANPIGTVLQELKAELLF
ncbi:MAG: S1 family peptidase [Thioalkalivibrio sp.]|nr:S1 family peptidase [Thioalkalivibrio sp.]